MTVNVKPVDFKFGEYISNAIDLMKKDLGNFIVAYIFVIIMSIIPLCGLLAIGNFYKYCRKVYYGEPTSPSEIFNFDDFVPYLLAQLVLIACILPFYIPMIVMSIANGDGEPSPAFGVAVVVLALAMMAVVFWLLVKAFYIPGLISLRKVQDLKTAWNMSNIMTKGNFMNILLFVIVVSFLAQLGILACFIGLIVTMPFVYVSHYFAYEDAFKQLEDDEIKEIGVKNEA